MYDDPYEESPLTPIALSCASAAKYQQQQLPYQQQQLQQQLQLQQQQLQLQQQLQQQLEDLDMNESACRKSACTQTSTLVKDQTSSKSLEAKNECQKTIGQPTTTLGESTGKILSNGPPVIAQKFYQLSAEYGGNDIPDDDDEDEVGNYTDLQEEGVLAERLAKPLEESIYPEGVVLPPVARHARIPLPLGTYEEPWDLSVTQRGLEDRLHAKRSSGDAMMSSVTLDDPRPRDVLMSRSCYAEPLRKDGKGKEAKSPESGFPVYGVPWSIRPKDSKKTQGSSVDGPSAGVVKVKAKVPVRSSSLRPVDSRPMEDYDEPWDQKKKIICKTGKKTVVHLVNKV